MSSTDVVGANASKDDLSSSSSTGPDPKVKSEPSLDTSKAESAAAKAREILPVVHDIIRTVEKDNQDMTQKNKDSLETSQKVLELQRRIASIREDVHSMPGIERSRKEQLKQLQALRLQVRIM